MDIKIKGEQTISGSITPCGSKNSAVALIPATLLFDKPITLTNIPEITDVDRLIHILKKLGSKIHWDKSKASLTIDNKNVRSKNLDQEDLGNMKGTSLLWGPMLARFKKVNFKDLPGGCTLGVRPLDVHYKAFYDLGVKVTDTKKSAKMDSTKAKAGDILLSEMSPTATENAIMLAVGISGTTTIRGAASEPQVQDLCEFLIKCGASIKGVGSNILTINGGRTLTPANHKIYPDHYEIATFLAISAATGGHLTVNDYNPKIFRPIKDAFEKLGVKLIEKENQIILKKQKLKSHKNGVTTIKAQPWPALPVDALPLFIPLALARKDGQFIFHNWMYESGLFWTSELQKLGANVIMADPHRVIVTAGNKLYGDKLEAPYIIRAVVALAMSAMIAKGQSTILNADALYRGHPRFVENLKKLGATIEELN